MARSLRLAYAALSVIAITLAAACAATPEPVSQPASEPTPAEPTAPGPSAVAVNPLNNRGPAPKSECVSDAECGGGMACTSHIWAACDVCDGGVLYRTCTPR